LDQLDAEILRMLESGARQGVSELAQGLGVTRNTVLARLRRLQTSGVLKRYSAVIDLSRAGLPVHALVALEVEQRRLSTVLSTVERIPQVLEVHELAGREDLLLRVAARSPEDLRRLVLALLEVPGVRHTNTTLMVSTPIPYRTEAALQMLTESSGFGRSTPLPTLPPARAPQETPR
jgi:DNA-binding Lrp family transcriptional regulator